MFHSIAIAEADWRRAYEQQPGDAGNLIGYHYLPGRDDAGGVAFSYGSILTTRREWVVRKKFGGLYRLAPIMLDRVQQNGTGWMESVGGQSTLGEAHRGNGNVPTGANFYTKTDMSNGESSIGAVRQRPLTKAFKVDNTPSISDRLTCKRFSWYKIFLRSLPSRSDHSARVVTAKMASLKTRIRLADCSSPNRNRRPAHVTHF